MKVNLDNPTDDSRIEILPLIDVIFCILIFFILATLQLTRQQGIAVDLPKAESGVPQIREVFVVSVDVLGQIYVEQSPVTQDELRQRLIGYKTTNPNGLMVLYAPRNAIYQDVVSVLDLLRSIGGDRVALATLPGLSETPVNPGLSPVPTSPTLTPGLPQGSPRVPASPNLQPGGSNLNPLPGQQLPANSGNNSAQPGTTIVPANSPGAVNPQAPGGMPGQVVPIPGAVNPPSPQGQPTN